MSEKKTKNRQSRRKKQASGSNHRVADDCGCFYVVDACGCGESIKFRDAEELAAERDAAGK